MKDTILLSSRGYMDNSLKKLSSKTSQEESKTYVLKSASTTMRSGNLEKGKKFIDPAGGPVIIEGQYLEDAEAVVKSIDYIVGYGYTITFE